MIRISCILKCIWTMFCCSNKSINFALSFFKLSKFYFLKINFATIKNFAISFFFSIFWNFKFFFVKYKKIKNIYAKFCFCCIGIKKICDPVLCVHWKQISAICNKCLITDEQSYIFCRNKNCNSTKKQKKKKKNMCKNHL